MKPHKDASGPQTGWHNLIRGRRLPFKLGVIATLAIAIGANIAVLGNLGVLFGPVVPGATHYRLLEPYLQPMALKSLSPSQAGIPRPVYDALAAALKGRADVAFYEPDWGSFIIHGGQPHYMPYLITTASLTKVLGVHAIAGRMLNSGDSLAGSPPVIVIAARLAKSEFSSAEAAVGKVLTFNGKDRTIVGVLPASLSFPTGIHTPAEAWVPIPPESSALIGTLQFIDQYALVHTLVPLSQAALKVSLADAYRQSLARYKSDEQHFLNSIDTRMRVATLAEREFGPVLTRLKVLEIAAVLLL
ncbi:MAG: ABC transporter permease, partial [Gammaproteobacteria bacterium]|nr:ABC transporter permease [Gammaproteobacteria bacterium]